MGSSTDSALLSAIAALAARLDALEVKVGIEDTAATCELVQTIARYAMGRAFTTADLFDNWPPEAYVETRRAIARACRGTVSAKAVGKLLARHAGDVIGGYQITRDGKLHNCILWLLVPEFTNSKPVSPTGGTS